MVKMDVTTMTVMRVMKLKTFNIVHIFYLHAALKNHPAKRRFDVQSSWFLLYACRLCVE